MMTYEEMRSSGHHRVGFFLISPEDPMMSTMGRYHPFWSPDYDDIGPEDEAGTWASAYHLYPSLTEVMEDADNGDFPELGEDEAIIHVAAVNGDGVLIVSANPIDDIAIQEHTDDPEALMVAAGDDVHQFTKEQVYSAFFIEPPSSRVGPSP